jgi:hypothetical protein
MVPGFILYFRFSLQRLLLGFRDFNRVGDRGKDSYKGMAMALMREWKASFAQVLEGKERS